MRGSLQSRGRNTWYARVYLGRDEKGRKRYLTRTIHGTKRFAEDLLPELLMEAGRTDVVAEGTLADLVQRWEAVADANMSPTTLREYRRLLDRLVLPRFGHVKVRNLRAADLDAFYADLQRRGGANGGALSAQSVHHVHSLLRGLLNQAVKWGWIAVSPAARATPPRVQRHDIRVPPVQDVEKLIRSAEDRDPELGCFLHLAVVTGARRGELCGLRWNDLDQAAGTLSISRSVVGEKNGSLIEKGTKTHAGRRIALDQATQDMLDSHHQHYAHRAEVIGCRLMGSAYMFSDSPEGSAPWRPNRVTLAFVRLCRDTGIDDLRLHDLRHFAATQMLTAGVPVNTVAGRLGHANPATTLNVYAHFLESSDEVAANVLGSLLGGNGSTRGTTKRSGPAK